MDETQQDDTANRGAAGSLRVPGPDEGEIADIVCAAGHAYQVVHSQESTWVFYLRLTTIDGDSGPVVRIVLRPTGPAGSGVRPDDVRFFPAGGNWKL